MRAQWFLVCIFTSMKLEHSSYMKISYLDFNIHDIAVRAPINIAISGWICDVFDDVLCCRHGPNAILHAYL